MALELHNFIWEEVRLVQVETQPHHFAGVVAEIRNTLENSDCEWADIYSAYYECEEDSTITCYEGEGVGAGDPGVRTYVVYDCTAGKEEVVVNLNIKTVDRALRLRQVFKDREDSRLPTQKQSNTAIFLCQLLSNLYQPIQVFRYDRKLKTIYIQAGVNDEIAILIDEDGSWEFIL